MTVSLQLKGSKELRRQLAKLSDDIQETVAETIGEVAADLETAIKLSIQQGAKTGRIYKRGGVMHQASAPGQAPANDTGVLMGSIYHEREAKLTYVVGARAKYSLHLEYGTSRMAARPFFRPAIEDIKPIFDEKLTAAIAGAIK